jgi:hypothetical protein
MRNFSSDSISAFMAIGRRYSVDIKLHGMGTSVVLIQIDVPSYDEFIDGWKAANADFIRTVNAFFDIHLTNSHSMNTLAVKTEEGMIARDRKALEMSSYAINTRNHESSFETLQCIAEFVNFVSKNTSLSMH